MSRSPNDPPREPPRVPLRVALLGSGLFATNSHAPVLRSNPSYFRTVAVWSRSPEKSEALASTFRSDDGKTGRKTDDECESYGGSDGLATLLGRDDVDAVIMALPLDVQPQYVTMALEAGKHVLSEKPVAPSVEVALELVEAYRTTYRLRGLRWSVAENFRYEPAMIRAVEAVKGIGKPLLLTLAVHSPFTPDNKYLATPWRTSPSWYGGLFVDAFVHGTAGLRLVSPSKPTKVSATTSSAAEHIPGVDTLAARVEFEDGMMGVVTATYASTEGYFEMDVTGTAGRVHVTRVFGDRPGYRVETTGTGAGDGVSEHSFGGIEAEFLAFAAVCSREASPPQDDNGGDCNTPEEALADLSFVEACLESGRNGGEARSVKSYFV